MTSTPVEPAYDIDTYIVPVADYPSFRALIRRMRGTITYSSPVGLGYMVKVAY